MDKLDEIFDMQQSFNQDLIAKRHLDSISDTEWIQKHTLAMLSELAELLDEVNFKWWKNPKPVDIGAVKGELVDILHFFVSMCLNAGMGAEELHLLYLQKNKENFLRQKGLTGKAGYKVE
jgi:dimeric dUTPase (all-alpha-NTP-PPase superfamily)